MQRLILSEIIPGIMGDLPPVWTATRWCCTPFARQREPFDTCFRTRTNTAPPRQCPFELPLSVRYEVVRRTALAVIFRGLCRSGGSSRAACSLH
ncbi:hypothetical protein LIA77_04021 [Sarocladium implicatum]|nr:hypothetical protein LIA77_04021 [Sarocladium implicatum]